MICMFSFLSVVVIRSPCTLLLKHFNSIKYLHSSFCLILHIIVKLCFIPPMLSNTEHASYVSFDVQRVFFFSFYINFEYCDVTK